MDVLVCLMLMNPLKHPKIIGHVSNELCNIDRWKIAHVLHNWLDQWKTLPSPYEIFTLELQIFMCVFPSSLIPRFPCEMSVCIFFLKSSSTTLISTLHYYVIDYAPFMGGALCWVQSKAFWQTNGSTFWAYWHLGALAGWENGKELVSKMSKLHFVDLANPFFCFLLIPDDTGVCFIMWLWQNASYEYWTI